MGLEKVDTPVERRAKKRFVMEREIRYRVLEQGKIVAVGSGKTLNLSSNGVAFVGLYRGVDRLAGVARKPVSPATGWLWPGAEKL
jgi:hypothetical protein